MKRHQFSFAFSFALLAACAADPQAEFAQAVSAYEAHDYAAARLHLLSALKERPDHAGMLLLQARTTLALGDGSGAGVVLDKLRKMRPGGEIAELSAEAALLRRSPEVALRLLGDVQTAEAERLRALAALQDNDTTTAQKHFSRSVALGGDGRAFADFARFRMLQGDVEGAEDMLVRAIKVEPKGLDTLLVSGDFAVRRGDRKAGLDRFSEAARLYPSNFAAKIGQAAVLGDLGRLDEMDRILARLSEQGVKGLDLTYLRARSAIARKQWAAARDVIQPIDSELPPLHPIRVLYAKALVELGSPPQAISMLQPVVRNQPGNREAVQVMARAQAAAGDNPAAVRTLRAIADSPQARPEELDLMAKVATAAGDASSARYAARASRPAPQVLGGDLAEADAAMRQRDWARAEAAYNRVLAATDGKNAMVLNNMANVQLMLGNHAEAREFAARALKQAPGNPSMLDTAGWIAFKTGGDPGEARRLLRIAAEKAPSNATIKRHLAEVEVPAD